MQTQSTDRPRVSAANLKITKPSASGGSLVARLRELDQTLLSCSKHDRVITIILACLSGEARASNEVAALAIDLGFDRKHVWLMINKGMGQRWRKDAEGRLVAIE